MGKHTKVAVSVVLFGLLLVFCSSAAAIDLDANVYEIKIPQGYTAPWVARNISDNHQFAGVMLDVARQKSVPFIGSEAGIGVIEGYFDMSEYYEVTPLAISQSGYVVGKAQSQNLVDQVPFLLLHGRMVNLGMPAGYQLVSVGDVTDYGDRIYVAGLVGKAGTTEWFPIIWVCHYSQTTDPFVDAWVIEDTPKSWRELTAIAYNATAGSLYMVGLDTDYEAMFSSFNFRNSSSVFLKLGEVQAMRDVNSNGEILAKVDNATAVLWQVSDGQLLKTVNLLPYGEEVGTLSPYQINDTSQFAGVVSGSNQGSYYLKHWAFLGAGKKMSSLGYDRVTYEIQEVAGLAADGTILGTGLSRRGNVPDDAIFMVFPLDLMFKITSGVIVKDRSIQSNDSFNIRGKAGGTIDFSEGTVFALEIGDEQFLDMIPLSNFTRRPGRIEYRDENKTYRIFNSGEVFVSANGVDVGWTQNLISVSIVIGGKEYLSSERWKKRITDGLDIYVR